MPEPITGAIAGATLLGSIGSSFIGANAAKKAAGAQGRAAQAGIDEQRRQFEAIQQVLSPYVQSGTGAVGGLSPYAQAGAPALAQQQALLGLAGPQAQQQAYAQIESSPAFQAMTRQGEQAILQNAAATGGLRGGNTQAALAQFRPQVLNQLIEQQYGRLGGLTALGQGTLTNIAQLGQSSAAGVGTAGLQTGQNVANLLGQQGSAQAGGIIGQGRGFAQLANLPGQIGGTALGYDLLSKAGGGTGIF